MGDNGPGDTSGLLPFGDKTIDGAGAACNLQGSCGGGAGICSGTSVSAGVPAPGPAGNAGCYQGGKAQWGGHIPPACKFYGGPIPV